tara:strand:- start:3029 stop:3385 length:357 start_codon:yes stop_codon:yes gene_type:complete
MNPISFSENKFYINNEVVTLDNEIMELHMIKDKILVLLQPGKVAIHYKNMRAFDLKGNLLWIADLPSVPDYFPGVCRSKLDFYWNITNKDPLEVSTFSCWACKIDLNTGKILKQDFTK